MKNSILVLIHKKGPKNNPLNYRPITLNNASLKILDSFLAGIIEPILYNNGYMNELQYGATKNKSCTEPIFNLRTIKE